MMRISKVVPLLTLCSVLVLSAQAAVAVTVEVAATPAITFDPADVTINLGDSVRWSGLQGGFHTVAQVDDGAATVWNGGFHSAASASEFTFAFNSPGVFHYICEPHVLAGMRGTVTVLDVVPTVSEWGLMVMAVLVVAAGAFLTSRRRGVQA